MNVLVIRFSSIGDVALTLPAIKNALDQNKDLTITYLSKPFFEPLFQNSDRLKFIGADLNQSKGLLGLLKLSKSIKAGNPRFDAIVDLHDSLRSKIIRSYFSIFGSKIGVIDKGRKDKKALTRKSNKIFKPLLHHTVRYANTFHSVGIPVQINQEKAAYIVLNENDLANANTFFNGIGGGKEYIGIAPFTTSILKEWPFDKVKTLASNLLLNAPNRTILLFGGKADIPKIQSLIALNQSQIKSAIGINGGLGAELAVIKRLDIMICMDSGNMHLSTMLGTKVKAIFGPTHPYLGFAPFKQEDNVIQLTDLSCRPCSVFGNKSCWRKDHACMEALTIEPGEILK